MARSPVPGRGLAVALAAAALLVAAASATGAARRSDVSIWGHAIPQPIKHGERSTLKFTVKNNGPDGAVGVYLHANVPDGLRIKRWHLYGGRGCRVKGTYVSCDFGDFAMEQTGTVVLRVKGVKDGTWISDAAVYERGNGDYNEGNGQVRATLLVQPR
ncbi:DUF11 domain-containing protein [Capillimicrobium parvum]|uniref:DUF11 domain-containing protein n=1 Tax=Capillimicrobium parvum TaxID=2884022 RepID=A0A9E6Y0N8_9ACTN|nr:DUF11 domain-containing protein [Capillimicrobium parvum]UGS37608.1 hypothetical protein DSM104329_04026 [Capillimicrobium parvum]